MFSKRIDSSEKMSSCDIKILRSSVDDLYQEETDKWHHNNRSSENEIDKRILRAIPSFFREDETNLC